MQTCVGIVQGRQGLDTDLTREDIAMSLTFINTNKLPRKMPPITAR